jgi:WD40 repeat protein
MVTGDFDGQITLYDASNQIMSEFKPFNEPVTILKFVPNQEESFLAVVGSENHTGVWNLIEKRCTYTITCHSGSVTDLSFHPLNSYAVFGSFDSTWSFHDLVSGKILG